MLDRTQCAIISVYYFRLRCDRAARHFATTWRRQTVEGPLTGLCFLSVFGHPLQCKLFAHLPVGSSPPARFLSGELGAAVTPVSTVASRYAKPIEDAGEPGRSQTRCCLLCADYQRRAATNHRSRPPSFVQAELPTSTSRRLPVILLSRRRPWRAKANACSCRRPRLRHYTDLINC